MKNQTKFVFGSVRGRSLSTDVLIEGTLEVNLDTDVHFMSGLVRGES